MKRKICTILLLLSMMLLLTSCSAFSSKSSDKADLTIMGKATDMEKSYMTRIFDLYEETTGKRLDIIKVEDSEFETAAEKAFKGNNKPDVLMHFNNSGLNNLDISSNFYYLNDESWIDDLTDGSKAYCQDSQGNILGLPFWESSVSGCYYNKKLLDSMGLKPAGTQTEFNALCQALTDIGYTPICWAADGCNWMYQFAMDPIFADNPSLLDELNSGKISYADIPAVADMTEWISDAADKGWFGKSYLTNTWDDLSPIMSSGKAAMIFIWDTWFYTDFKEDGKYTKEDFALMPVFMNTAENGTYEGGNLNMMMVNKNSERKENALEFLSFCAAPENYNKAFDGISTVNCFNGQTTNIRSHMVTNAMPSIQANQRVSTAESKIVGYSQEDTASAFVDLFKGKVDVDGCIKLMDKYRMEAVEK